MNRSDTLIAPSAYRWRTAGLLCAVALLWLATRPYFGTVFDARFYMLEALNDLHPGRFSEDLYFKFGSQGSFSLFAKFYQPLLPVFGVGATGIILTVMGQLLWLFGLFRLTRSLAGGNVMWLSIAVAIGMLSIYAPYFRYGEGYVTARLFAEALVMLGLSVLFARPIWTFVLLGISALIHPLMTLPGIGVALVYLALGRPIWWAVMGAGAGAVVALGLAGVEPFTNLFRTIDPEWFAVIKVRVIQCLLTAWPMENLMQAAGATAWAVAALVTVGPGHRRFLTAVLLVGVGGLVCTYLGGDIARNVLVVEVQPWRSMWLLHLVSRIYIPLILMALFARTSLDSFRWTTLLTMVLILVSSAIPLVRFPGSAEFTPVFLALVAAALVLMSVQLLLAETKRRPVALISALAGFALIPIALARWDARPPWIRFWESSEPPPKDLAALLPDKASVYWEDGLEILWLRLKRPSYFACDQGTGAIFYRDIATVYKRRADSFWPLRTSDFSRAATCASFDTRPKPERNRAGLQKLCVREPELDYVVLIKPLDGVRAQVWKSPVRFQTLRTLDGQMSGWDIDRFYIYSCAPMR